MSGRINLLNFGSYEATTSVFNAKALTLAIGANYK